jgi:hypothetical protein
VLHLLTAGYGQLRQNRAAPLRYFGIQGNDQMKIDGRCHCGDVTFEAEADPETTTICNCTDCQTMSVAPRSCFCRANRRNIERPPIAEMSVCRVSALIAGQRSTRHPLAMSQKPTMCGLDRYANEMNWFHGGNYLFARNRDGSTTSTQFRNSTVCRRADPGRRATLLRLLTARCWHARAMPVAPCRSACWGTAEIGR